MANVLSSTHSVLPYGMLLTTIFQHFEINLDGETDICICKLSNAIDNGSISQLGYKLQRNEWVLKTTRVHTTVEEVNDEEEAMDIPPLSPTAAPSLTPGAGFSSTSFDYASALQDLFHHLDTISLDVQQLQLDHQEDMRILIGDMCTLTGDFHAYREEQNRRLQELLAQQANMFQYIRSNFPPPL